MESENTINYLPKHVAIILDGNGRWAQQRDKKRMEGHVVGSENVINITRECSNLGIKVLTLYAFSTENWKRPAEEVRSLMNLLIKFIREHLAELNKNNVRLATMGDLSKLPFASRKAVNYAKNKTKNNTGMILNIGLNYGGRDEICRAVNRYISNQMKSDDRNSNLSGELEITSQDLESYLDTADFAELDMIIRTGGEKRLSNFLLWQAAYAEFFFTSTLWPDFTVDELNSIFQEYAKRNRRYGGVV